MAVNVERSTRDTREFVYSAFYLVFLFDPGNSRWQSVRVFSRARAILGILFLPLDSYRCIGMRLLRLIGCALYLFHINEKSTTFLKQKLRRQEWLERRTYKAPLFA